MVLSRAHESSPEPIRFPAGQKQDAPPQLRRGVITETLGQETKPSVGEDSANAGGRQGGLSQQSRRPARSWARPGDRTVLPYPQGKACASARYTAARSAGVGAGRRRSGRPVSSRSQARSTPVPRATV